MATPAPNINTPKLHYSNAPFFKIMNTQNNKPTNESKLTTLFHERLVPLCNGQPGLRGKIQVEIRQPSATPGEIRDNSCNSFLDFIASDETLDRYNEVIVASGWKLDNYARNPVFQNSH